MGVILSSLHPPTAQLCVYLMAIIRQLTDGDLVDNFVSYYVVCGGGGCHVTWASVQFSFRNVIKL